MAGASSAAWKKASTCRPGQFKVDEWGEIADELSAEAESSARGASRAPARAQRPDRPRPGPALEKSTHTSTDPNQLLDLLNLMAQGARIVFDRKTHRQGWQRTTRLRYVYLAAHLLGEPTSQAVTEDVLEHLEGAQEALPGCGRRGGCACCSKPASA